MSSTPTHCSKEIVTGCLTPSIRLTDPDMTDHEKQIAIDRLLIVACHENSKYNGDYLGPLNLLLHSGAKPNAIDPVTGRTCLMEAVWSPTLVRYLLSIGADVTARDPCGRTALTYAVMRPDAPKIKTYRLLMAYCKWPDYDAAIQAAAAHYANLDMMQYLLGCSTDVELNEKIRSLELLNHACCSPDRSPEHYNLLRWLLKYDRLSPTFRRINPMCLVNAAWLGNDQACEILVKGNVDTDAKNAETGESAFYYASRMGNGKIANMLLTELANPTLENKYGNHALQIAALGFQVDMVDMLGDNVLYADDYRADSDDLLGCAAVFRQLGNPLEFWKSAIYTRENAGLPPIIESKFEKKLEFIAVQVADFELLEEICNEEDHTRRYAQSLVRLMRIFGMHNNPEVLERLELGIWKFELQYPYNIKLITFMMTDYVLNEELSEDLRNRLSFTVLLAIRHLRKRNPMPTYEELLTLTRLISNHSGYWLDTGPERGFTVLYFLRTLIDLLIMVLPMARPEKERLLAIRDCAVVVREMDIRTDDKGLNLLDVVCKEQTDNLRNELVSFLVYKAKFQPGSSIRSDQVQWVSDFEDSIEEPLEDIMAEFRL